MKLYEIATYISYFGKKYDFIFRFRLILLFMGREIVYVKRSERTIVEIYIFPDVAL
jgi:hypothetical protein